MKLKLLTKIFCSLILLVILTLTMIVIFPSVATAQDFDFLDNNAAHKSLQQGLDAEAKGTLDTAKKFYKLAIAEVKKNRDMEVFIVAKNNLANLLQAQGEDAEEVTQLWKERDAALIALGKTGRQPKECLKTCPNGKKGEDQVIGGQTMCVTCPSDDGSL